MYINCWLTDNTAHISLYMFMT